MPSQTLSYTPPLGKHQSILYVPDSVSVSKIGSFVSYMRFHICDIIWYLSFLSGLLHLVW